MSAKCYYSQSRSDQKAGNFSFSSPIRDGCPHNRILAIFQEKLKAFLGFAFLCGEILFFRVFPGEINARKFDW